MGSLVLFRLGARDAFFVEPNVAPHFTAMDLTELPNYPAVVRLVTDDKMTRAFSFQSAGEPSKVDPDKVGYIRMVFTDKYRVRTKQPQVDKTYCNLRDQQERSGLERKRSRARRQL